MPDTPVVRVGRTRDGYCVSVEGRGTYLESQAVHAFAVRVLEDGACRITIDLRACTYIDSTFLGSLVSLHKRYGGETGGRYGIVVGPERRRALFGVSQLDRVLRFQPECPPAEGELCLSSPPPADREALGRYVVECHRRLAELGGPEAAAFEQVAEALAGELDKKTPGR